MAKIKTVVLWVVTPSSFMEELKKLDEIGDFSSIHPYKMQTIAEEERKGKWRKVLPLPLGQKINSALKMKAVGSSETLAAIYETA